MSENNNTTLKTDENFERLISALSYEEFRHLEHDILRDGCREPICVWNNTIVDGYNRYEICTRLQIPYDIQNIDFNYQEAVISWICANQLNRQNISNEMRMYLIGKRYEAEKILSARTVAGLNPLSKNEIISIMRAESSFNKSPREISVRLGEEYRISYATVKKYGQYATALDSLFKLIPDFAKKILSGIIKISQDNVIELSELNSKDVQFLYKKLSDEADNYIGYANICKVLPKRQSPSRQPIQIIPSGSVKNMPVYDPDAEISSLAFTIPSWVSSIKRTHSAANLKETSSQAQLRLEKELLFLNETINAMLTAIREEIL